MIRTISSILVLLSILPCFSQEKNGASLDYFLDRWALYLPGGAGWLEVRQEAGTSMVICCGTVAAYCLLPAFF